MKEWWVWFEYANTFEEENLIVLPSIWKVLRWFLLTAWRCGHIEISVRYR